MKTTREAGRKLRTRTNTLENRRKKRLE